MLTELVLAASYGSLLTINLRTLSSWGGNHPLSWTRVHNNLIKICIYSYHILHGVLTSLAASTCAPEASNSRMISECPI